MYNKSSVAKIIRNGDVEDMRELLSGNFTQFKDQLDRALINDDVSSEMKDIITIHLYPDRVSKSDREVLTWNNYPLDLSVICDSFDKYVDSEDEIEMLKIFGHHTTLIKLYIFLRCTPLDKEQILKDMGFDSDQVSSMCDNELMEFMTCGPLNPVVGWNYNHDSLRYRMRSSYDQVIGAAEECDCCQKPIEDLMTSYRRPLPMGGWFGCYCSWTHMIESSCPNVYEQELISIFEEQLAEMDEM